MVSALAGHHPAMSILPVGSRRLLTPDPSVVLGGSEAARTELTPALTRGRALAYAASGRS
jgi:hypothetical protein